jgi:hypothetical protein
VWSSVKNNLRIGPHSFLLLSPNLHQSHELFLVLEICTISKTGFSTDHSMRMPICILKSIGRFFSGNRKVPVFRCPVFRWSLYSSKVVHASTVVSVCFKQFIVFAGPEYSIHTSESRTIRHSNGHLLDTF